MPRVRTFIVLLVGAGGAVLGMIFSRDVLLTVYQFIQRVTNQPELPQSGFNPATTFAVVLTGFLVADRLPRRRRHRQSRESLA